VPEDDRDEKASHRGQGQQRGDGEAGHYPQSQRPDLTTGAVLRFLATAQSRTEDQAGWDGESSRLGS
jgi:hypothetical protein